MSKRNTLAESKPNPARNTLLIVGILLISANLRPALTSVGPLIESLRSDMGLSNGLAGLLTTLPLFGFALMSPLIPKISHRFGQERTLLAGLIILFCGIVIRSLPHIAALFLGAAMLGLGIAIGNVLLPGLVKNKFPHKVGLMTSLYSTCMVIFAASASGLSVPLAQGAGLGWEHTLLSWAILTLLTMIIWLPQLRARTDSKIYPSTPHRNVWTSFLAWKVTLFLGLQAFSYYIAVAWLPEIIHAKGISLFLAGWMLSLMQFISLPLTFIAPLLADRLTDQRPIIIAISVFYFAGYGGLLVGGSTVMLMLYMVFIGFAQGASISLALAFLGLRSANTRQAAELSGMAQSVGYLLASAGPLFIGFLFDLTHSWALPLISILVSGVILTLSGWGAAKNQLV